MADSPKPSKAKPLPPSFSAIRNDRRKSRSITMLLAEPGRTKSLAEMFGGTANAPQPSRDFGPRSSIGGARAAAAAAGGARGVGSSGRSSNDVGNTSGSGAAAGSGTASPPSTGTFTGACNACSCAFFVAHAWKTYECRECFHHKNQHGSGDESPAVGRKAGKRMIGRRGVESPKTARSERASTAPSRTGAGARRGQPPRASFLAGTRQPSSVSLNEAERAEGQETVASERKTAEPTQQEEVKADATEDAREAAKDVSKDVKEDAKTVVKEDAKDVKEDAKTVVKEDERDVKDAKSVVKEDAKEVVKEDVMEDVKEDVMEVVPSSGSVGVSEDGGGDSQSIGSDSKEGSEDEGRGDSSDNGDADRGGDAPSAATIDHGVTKSDEGNVRGSSMEEEEGGRMSATTEPEEGPIETAEAVDVKKEGATHDIKQNSGDGDTGEQCTAEARLEEDGERGEKVAEAEQEEDVSSALEVQEAEAEKVLPEEGAAATAEPKGTSRGEGLGADECYDGVCPEGGDASAEEDQIKKSIDGEAGERVAAETSDGDDEGVMEEPIAVPPATWAVARVDHAQAKPVDVEEDDEDGEQGEDEEDEEEDEEDEEEEEDDEEIEEEEIDNPCSILSYDEDQREAYVTMFAALLLLSDLQIDMSVAYTFALVAKHCKLSGEAMQRIRSLASRSLDDIEGDVGPVVAALRYRAARFPVLFDVLTLSHAAVEEGMMEEDDMDLMIEAVSTLCMGLGVTAEQLEVLNEYAGAYISVVHQNGLNLLDEDDSMFREKFVECGIPQTQVFESGQTPLSNAIKEISEDLYALGRGGEDAAEVLAKIADDDDDDDDEEEDEDEEEEGEGGEEEHDRGDEDDDAEDGDDGEEEEESEGEQDDGEDVSFCAMFAEELQNRERMLVRCNIC